MDSFLTPQVLRSTHRLVQDSRGNLTKAHYKLYRYGISWTRLDGAGEMARDIASWNLTADGGAPFLAFDARQTPGAVVLPANSKP